MNQQWKLVPARATKAMQDAWDTAPFNEDTDAEFHGAYAAMIAAAPASEQPERDWELSCDHCDGDGFVYVERRVGPCATDIQTFKEDCDCCEGRGFTIAFEDIPGIDAYVKSRRTAPASAQDDAREAVMDAIAEALGDAYDCTRVWAAWGVGTMSQDDFRLVADDAGRLGELADAAIAAMRPAPAVGDAQIYRDAAFEAVRKRLCAIPRYSFYLDDDGVVRRVVGRSGNWIEFDAAHELFDPVCVDAAIAAQEGRK